MEWWEGLFCMPNLDILVFAATYDLRIYYLGDKDNEMYGEFAEFGM